MTNVNRVITVQQRGCKSTASVALAPFRPSGPPRIEPPRNLAPDATVVFTEIIASAPQGEYQADRDLLAAYAGAVVQERSASAAIAADVASATPALLRAQKQAQHAMVMLSRRLRIGPLGRQPNRSVRANTRAATQLSYYDLQALERANGRRSDGS